MREHTTMKISSAFRKHSQLANEFLQARFLKDWEQSRNTGTTSITKHLHASDRSRFRDAFQKLTQEGCRGDVLFPCLFIFLNSQQAGVAFPWLEDFEPIENALSKTREAIQKVMNSPGFQALKTSASEPSFATFADFVSAQRSLLKSATKYEAELQFVLKGLPRKDLVRQYGRAMICIYVRVVLRAPRPP